MQNICAESVHCAVRWQICCALLRNCLKCEFSRGFSGKLIDDITTLFSVSNIVPDSPHKIFIGGLPSYLSAEQVCWCTAVCSL